MKFTEGYWEKNERANASYAMQAFTAEAIPGGMRIVSPFRQITDRGGALDVGTITTEFISVRKDIISVRSYHYEGYVKGEPRYELFYPQLGVKLCSMAGGGVQKIYMVFLREPSRRDRSGSDLFHLWDGFEIKMNFDRNVSCFIFVNALMHDDFFD